MTQAAILSSLGSSGISTGFKNRIINGAMVIDQRNAGASVATSSGSGVYTVDRWIAQYSATSKFTVQQSSTAPTGFTNSVLITSSAATSVTTSAYYLFSQRIEGYNIADLGFGTANAKTITISFWVRSSLTGTFGGLLGNDNQDRSYPFSYTISSANTWEQKSITIAGDTSGTWAKDNTCGMKLWFSLGAGSTFQGTAGAWVSSNIFTVSGETQLVATSGATWYLSGVQLEVGTTATNFEYRDYGNELRMCQRYYAKLTSFSGGGLYTAFCNGYANSGTVIVALIKYPVTMRSGATVGYSAIQSDGASGAGYSVTALGGTYSGTDSAYQSFTTANSTMTAGQAINIVGSNSTSAYISLSAEL